MLTEEQQERAKEMLRTEVKAYFDVRDELGLSKEEYYELIRLDVHEWRIRSANGKTNTPPKAREKLVTLFSQRGENSAHEIARELRIVPQNAVKALQSIGMKPVVTKGMFSKARPMDIERKICDLYDLGLSIANILIELEYYFNTTKSISDILNKYGKSHKLQKRNEFHINSHVFDFIDTEEKAYWLGIMITDGWIHLRKSDEKNISNVPQIGLSLQKSDVKVMEEFKKFIGTSRTLLTKKNTLESGEVREYWSIVVDSENLFNALQRYGVIERKSYQTEPQLHLIPRELHKHFWRGCYDGDGSTYFGGADNLTVSYVGDKDIVYKLIANLYFGGVINHFRTPYLQDKSIDIANGINATADMYTFKYADKTDVYNILKYLYDGATIYMDRKNEFWEELKAERGKNNA